jgi:hypothetical protein
VTAILVDALIIMVNQPFFPWDRRHPAGSFKTGRHKTCPYQQLTSTGFAITDSTGQLAGQSALFNEPLIAALHIVETIVSAPELLANLLEAAGGYPCRATPSHRHQPPGRGFRVA